MRSEMFADENAKLNSDFNLMLDKSVSMGFFFFFPLLHPSTNNE